MKKFITRIVDLQPNEVRIFLWTALLIFLIRASSIIFNNFGETAFLKRFGVEYLPLVYVANSIVTFFIMGVLTGWMKRTPSAKMLGGMLIFCGASVTLLRFVVIADFSMIYPVIFLLKAQYEALLSLVFWNLANDLFNTRQSKRIFPLITAGGVTGGILGSFATPSLAKAISLNNLMLVYLVTTSLAALVVWRMSQKFPTLRLEERTVKKGAKGRSSIVEELKKVVPLLKESTLVKILVLITFLPNVLIPIMNYQFNFAVNEAFATEGGMITFFGYFRGILNVISLVILLFVGKLYSRWGLPVALMFHPANYLIAFMAFLFRFDIYSAMYARISTNVLRTTINNPARDILMGLFPAEYRPLLRPFLRGTVVRLGILLGSGFIMLFEGALHPRWLSAVGVLFAGMWVASSIWLKKSYSAILLDLVSQKVLDLKSLETGDMGRIFQDRRSKDQLLEACRKADGQACVWYAEMMTSQALEGADEEILQLLKEKDEGTVIGLLPLVGPEMGEKALTVYRELADPKKPKLCAALAVAASRLPGEANREFLERLAQGVEQVEVQALAVGGLYQYDPKQYGAMIGAWLGSSFADERAAGAKAAGGSGDAGFIPRLREILGAEPELSVQKALISALQQLNDPGLGQEIIQRAKTSPESLPPAVLKEFEVSDRESTGALISLLGSEDAGVREIALDKLKDAAFHDTGFIIESLALPNRRIRRGLLELMEALKISDLDIINFVKTLTGEAYQDLAEKALLGSVPESPERELLSRHLEEKKTGRMELLLRVLATQDSSAKMRVVVRGLASPDERLRSNAVEALESMVGNKLSELILPLLEEMPLEDVLRKGSRFYKLPGKGQTREQLYTGLLGKRDWVTLYLTLGLVARENGLQDYAQNLAALENHSRAAVRSLARRLSAHGTDNKEAPNMAEAAEQHTSLSEKILMLRAMDIFSGLRVSEIAAVASVTEEEKYEPGQTIITEGEVGETMYLIVKGEVSVHKEMEPGRTVELARMSSGQYFGEMALFNDEVRSATIKAGDGEVELLSLHKREFVETVREYPQVALQICKELGNRLRELHSKIQALETEAQCRVPDKLPEGR